MHIYMVVEYSIFGLSLGGGVLNHHEALSRTDETDLEELTSEVDTYHAGMTNSESYHNECSNRQYPHD